jgi:uncharacterized membrane protein
MKHLFIDLDHTIILPKTGKFPGPDNWKFRPGILSKLYQHVEGGGTITIVTNRGGVDAGYSIPTEDDAFLWRVAYEIKTYLDDIEDYNSQFHIFKGKHKGHKYRKPEAEWVSTYLYNGGWNKDVSELPLDITVESWKVEDCFMVGDASGMYTVYRKYKDPYFNEAVWRGEEYNSFLNKFDDSEIESVKMDTKKNKITVEMYAGDTFLIERDFSDSDKMFAENAGMNYIDIETWMK